MTGSITGDGLLVGIVPSPPKTTGDTNRDLALLQNWIFQLYQVIAVQDTFVTNSSQTDSNFNPATLPDPTTSNIATAQATANSAYILADEAETDAVAAQATATAANDRTKFWAHGSFTITDPATTSVISLSPAQSDTNYDVLVTPSATGGSPPDAAYIVSGIAKTVNDFTVTIKAAPGGGNSVSFNYLLVRF